MSRSGKTILEANGLAVEFDGFRAINGLNFTMYDDLLTVVIGPNGAGKTTFLDVITGRTAAAAGTVRFDGTDITRMSECRIARLGMARKFQAPSVFPDLSVLENLRVAQARRKSLVGALFGRLDGAQLDRIDELLDVTQLQAEKRQAAGTLSHGQRQWLEIGMVLAARPRLVLLDEPIAGMTLPEIERTAELVRTVARMTSVLVIEHDMGFVRQIAQRVCVFHQGRQLTEGNFDFVSADPQVRAIYLGEEAA